MIKIDSSSETYESLVKDYEAKGYVLVGVYDHLEGQSISFLEPGEIKPEKELTEMDKLKKTIQELNDKILILEAGVKKNEESITELKEAKSEKVN